MMLRGGMRPAAAASAAQLSMGAGEKRAHGSMRAGGAPCAEAASVR